MQEDLNIVATACSFNLLNMKSLNVENGAIGKDVTKH